YFPMKPSANRFKFAALCAVAFLAIHAKSDGATVNLDFSNPTIGTNAFFGGLGPYVSTAALPPNFEIGFLNAANFGGQSVDVRVTATTLGNATLIGYFPNYSSSAASSPGGDLGVLYQNNGLGYGGVRYEMEFYESGTGFGTALNAPDVQLLLYDLDGESGFHTQTESATVEVADGLTNYSLGTAASGVTVTDNGSTLTFNGNNSSSFDGTSAAAAIVTYENTSSITVTFESTAISGSTSNPAFVAFDGNLNFAADFDNGFDPVTPVAPIPEPTVPLFSLLAGILLGFRRCCQA
ncbi:MAG: hypothetical protein AAGA58_02720, partial [Verrucomicrobiota bacterium]